MYTALYRKWRPEVFSSMSGQAHIVRILKNQLATNQIGHAYLFCGTRGTGKTTSARIFAKGVNCLAESEGRPCGQCDHCLEIQNGTFIDVIEIDAASNNGVENIRELRESVKYPPVKGKYKVYIIDEVHMLSTGAFNALLKTLEEPPSHVIFILATTEIHKLPATILSRCLRLDFRRISEKEIIDRLQEICHHNHIEIEEGALALIAANADGAMRDALSILDQCFSAIQGKVTRKDVVELLGTAGEETFLQISDALIRKSATDALMIIDHIATDGKDIRQFIKDWIYHFRNLMIAKYASKLEDIMNLSCENVEKIKAQSENSSMEFINIAIRELSKASADARWSTQPRILLELAAIKLTDLTEDASIDALVARVAELEGKMAKGVLIAGVTPQQMPAPPQTKMPLPQETRPPLPQAMAPSLEINMSHDELWAKIFRAGVAKKITFNMLAKGVGIIGMDDKTITLSAESAPKVTCVEQNADLIRDIVKDLTGKNLKVQCSSGTKPIENLNLGTEKHDELMDQLGKFLDTDKLTITD